jgi:glycosyltransferase involved in cell wall biosynthesis
LLAPLVESVPPRGYGGTERIVHLLAEGLVGLGHEVTLFASGDSVTKGQLIVCSPTGLRLAGTPYEPVASILNGLTHVFKEARSFDLIHNHIGWPAMPFARLWSTPTVSTIHGRIDLPTENAAYGLFSDQPFVSISDHQRLPLAAANWMGTVYNGIDVSRFTFRPTSGNYLVFLGRICPEKRPDRAIRIAQEAGLPLLIAAKIDPADRDYYDAVIEPLIAASPSVDFIGEVNDEEKNELLGGAMAYLFPIDWPEPFGLTMVEAMATGTPVIAWRRGSVPEVVLDGVTGFIGESNQELAEAVHRVGQLDRLACRRHVESHFSADRMIAGYEAVYADLLNQE